MLRREADGAIVPVCIEAKRGSDMSDERMTATEMLRAAPHMRSVSGLTVLTC